MSRSRTNTYFPFTLALLGLVLCFAPGPVRAGRVELKGRILANCTLRVAPGALDKVSSIERRLAEGLDRLNTIFENPPLRHKPEFWILTSATELDEVLRWKFGLRNQKARKAAVQAGVFRDSYRIVFVIRPDIPDDWLLRLLYTEHTRSLMDAAAPSAVQLRIGWFYAGMSAYLPWKVVAEQSGQSRELYERYFLQYYARYFNPAKDTPLQLLEVPADWHSALARNAGPVYAQSALVYLYLARKFGPTVGVRILRNYDREDAFSTAFERVVAMPLKKFEAAFKKSIYPQVRAIRGKR